MNLIPKRESRVGGDVIITHQDPDAMRPDGSVQPGRRVEWVTSPARWWRWLGRRWFIRVGA